MGADPAATGHEFELAARLAAIVESSNDAILGKSLDGVITSWNAGAARMYGYPAERSSGRTWPSSYRRTGAMSSGDCSTAAPGRAGAAVRDETPRAEALSLAATEEFQRLLADTVCRGSRAPCWPSASPP